MPEEKPKPPATLEDFKKRFVRDFKYGSGTDKIMDADIDNAMQDALIVFNPGLFSVADGFQGFLYLTAHFIRINIEASGGLQAVTEGLGVENQAEQVLSGASVGPANSNYVEPPAWVTRIPLFQQLWLTTYGQKYVAMAQPKLVGNVGVVDGPRDFLGGPGVIPPVPFVDQ